MRLDSRVLASFSCAIIAACTDGREVVTEPRAVRLAEIHHPSLSATPPISLSWPLDAAAAPRTGPHFSTARITALFDHHNLVFLNDVVRGAYPPRYRLGGHAQPGEEVQVVGGIRAPQIDLSEKTAPCGIVPPPFDAPSRMREVGIHYAPQCNGTDGGNIDYNNHAGIDIQAAFVAGAPTPVYAPIDGWVSYDQRGPGNNLPTDEHAVSICSTPDCRQWRVRLLHLSSWWDVGLGRARRARNPDGSGVGDCRVCPVKNETNRPAVTRGSIIGFSGNYFRYNYSPTNQCLKGWGCVPAHLHMEVLDSAGVPHDPYGWQSSLPDPMFPHANASLWAQSPAVLSRQANNSQQSRANVNLQWTGVNLRFMMGTGLQGAAETFSVDFQRNHQSPLDGTYGNCFVILEWNDSQYRSSSGRAQGLLTSYQSVATGQRVNLSFAAATPFHFDSQKFYTVESAMSFAFVDYFAGDVVGGNLFYSLDGWR